MTRTSIAAIMAIGLTLFVSVASQAAPSRFIFADQSDFGGKRGFYLDAENDTNGASKSEIGNLKCIAAVADGQMWSFLPSKIAFQTGHVYDLVLSVSKGITSLTIDGAVQGSASTPLAPADKPLTGDTVPSWANALTDYFIEEKSITVSQPGMPQLDASIPSSVASLFDSSASGIASPLKYKGGDLTVDIKFEILPSAPSETGLIDKYGQPTFVDYSGKIKSDSDLTVVFGEERRAHPWPEHLLDKWGGELHPSWHGKATGFYHLSKHNGFSWLIDPSGAPCFYLGVDTAAIPYWEGTPVTGRESLFQWLPEKGTGFDDAIGSNNWGSDPGIEYVRFTNANLIRKYGAANWQKSAIENRNNRLNEWGFSGVGKWCNLPETKPSVPVLEWNGVPNLIRRPDFFDPAVRTQMVATLKDQIAPHVSDPMIVGWSVGNEFDEIITTDEITKILALPESNPSRKALTGYIDLSNTRFSSPLSADDIERLRQYYADQYYGFVQKTVKSVDPNHLFFGFWLVPGWWQNPSDWTLQEAHVDVMGIDYYNAKFNSDLLAPLVAKSTVPVLIGEFSFPADYSSARGFGTYSDSVPTDKDAGLYYAKWIHDTSMNPNVIGDLWFQMYDEPITGRGPGHGSALVYGENFAFGLVRDTDTPKWGFLLGAVEDANLNADKWREQASSQKH